MESKHDPKRQIPPSLDEQLDAALLRDGDCQAEGITPIHDGIQYIGGAARDEHKDTDKERNSQK